MTDRPGRDTCPKCRADISQLVLGGVGDWHTCILCSRCYHIQRGVSYRHIIVPLAAQQLNISEEAIISADDMSQEEYEHVIWGGQSYPDLPTVLPMARWLARRILKGGGKIYYE